MESWIIYICGVITLIGVVLTVWKNIRAIHENRRGWRLTYDVWGIRYEEKIKEGVWESLLIRATSKGHGFCEAHVPSDVVWNSRYPSWARGRREEIIARISSERRGIPFVDEDQSKLQSS